MTTPPIWDKLIGQPLVVQELTRAVSDAENIRRGEHGPGMTHAQRVDCEPAVEDRDRHRLQQAEMPARGRERQRSGAQQPAGMPRHEFGHGVVVNAAEPRGDVRLDAVEHGERVG